MNLLEIVQRLSEFKGESDDVHTIYAQRPWQPSSPAIVILQPEDGRLPDEAKRLGYQYFLEVFIALEMLEGLRSKGTNMDTIVQKIIEYAENDA